MYKTALNIGGEVSFLTRCIPEVLGYNEILFLSLELKGFTSGWKLEPLNVGILGSFVS